MRLFRIWRCWPVVVIVGIVGERTTGAMDITIGWGDYEIESIK